MSLTSKFFRAASYASFFSGITEATLHTIDPNISSFGIRKIGMPVGFALACTKASFFNSEEQAGLMVGMVTHALLFATLSGFRIEPWLAIPIATVLLTGIFQLLSYMRQNDNPNLPAMRPI